MAVLSNIRQRSLMIAVIAFALFAFIIGDLFSSGGFSTTHQDVGSINGKDISFEDELKSVMLKKSTEGITSTAAANRVWDKRFL
jgi:peptidyl-prolyl cis-trans isomerase D